MSISLKVGWNEIICLIKKVSKQGYIFSNFFQASLPSVKKNISEKGPNKSNYALRKFFFQKVPKIKIWLVSIRIMVEGSVLHIPVIYQP